MASKLILVAAVLVALCALIQSSNALTKCYQCSLTDDCNDTYGKKGDHLKDCGAAYTNPVCRKTKTVVLGKATVARDCANGAGTEKKCSRLPDNNNDNYVETCYCDNADGCNGASAVSLSAAAVVFTAVVGFIRM